MRRRAFVESGFASEDRPRIFLPTGTITHARIFVARKCWRQRYIGEVIVDVLHTTAESRGHGRDTHKKLLIAFALVVMTRTGNILFIYCRLL